MQVKDPLTSRMRGIIGNALIFLGGLMLIGSAGAKLAHVPKVAAELGAMGFDGNKLIFIAILEILSALLFLIPVTRSFGLLMVSAYMGGAIATHVGHDQPAIQPAFVLAIFGWGLGCVTRRSSGASCALLSRQVHFRSKRIGKWA